MKLIITINQKGHRSKSVSTRIQDLSLETCGKLWEAEQTLNTIPGANLRVHISIEEEEE